MQLKCSTHAVTTSDVTVTWHNLLVREYCETIHRMACDTTSTAADGLSQRVSNTITSQEWYSLYHPYGMTPIEVVLASTGITLLGTCNKEEDY